MKIKELIYLYILYKIHVNKMFNSSKIKTMKTYKSYTNTKNTIWKNECSHVIFSELIPSLSFALFISFHFSYFLFYEVYNLHNLNLFTSILHIKQEQKFERYWIFYHCHNISLSLTVTEMFNDGKIAIYMYNGFHELFPLFQ
jgi:hypothetical protein